jgi:superfamily II helicase
MPNRHDQNRTFSQHIIVKTIRTENNERISRAVREKYQITYKGKLIKIRDLSIETLKANRAWSKVF